MKCHYIYIVCILLSSCYSSSTKDNKPTVTETITIDPDRSEKQLDLSPLLEDSFEIIKLEMTDQSLIADIDKIEISDDQIFISDKTSSKIFAFDLSGKYLRTIGQKGSGPGEFSYLGDFNVNGNSIYVQDVYGRKYIVYAKDGHLLKEIPYKSHHLGLLSFDQILYYINNYFDSGTGYYNLYRADLTNGKTEGLLPFNKELVDLYSRSALNHYASKYKENALLIYPRNDTIYNVTKNKVTPFYILHFTKRTIPKDLKEEIYSSPIEKGYLSGVEYLQNSKDYLLGTYVDKKRFRYLLINKKTLEYKIGERLVINNLGGLMIHSYTTTSEDELIVVISSSILKGIWVSICRNNTFKNKADKERLEKVISQLQEEDNPVLIKFKIKAIL